jgi:hypothetical protein
MLAEIGELATGFGARWWVLATADRTGDVRQVNDDAMLPSLRNRDERASCNVVSGAGVARPDSRIVIPIVGGERQCE